jgi:CRP-like cAMP-binding protein
MRTIAEYLPEHPFFDGLDAPTMDLVVGCARNVHFDEGSTIFRTGEPAETFYVVRRGDIALEVHDPNRGGLTVASLGPGEVVGWSWLVPPYRWMFDARATSLVRAVALDGACLRGKCADDPVLGYALMQRVAQVMYGRLQDARVRLLDLYGSQP